MIACAVMKKHLALHHKRYMVEDKAMNLGRWLPLIFIFVLFCCGKGIQGVPSAKVPKQVLPISEVKRYLDHWQVIPSSRKIIRIKVADKEDINELANMVAIWEVHPEYIITDATDEIIQKIKDKGFAVKILSKTGGTKEDNNDKAWYDSSPRLQEVYQRLLKDLEKISGFFSYQRNFDQRIAELCRTYREHPEKLEDLFYPSPPKQIPKNIGERGCFWIDYDDPLTSKIIADGKYNPEPFELVSDGLYCRVWVKEGFGTEVPPEDIRNIFDEKIYPFATQKYEHEPDVDGDTKINIIIMPFHWHGFFDPHHQLSASIAGSNQSEMIFLSSHLSKENAEKALMCEFVHLLFWNRSWQSSKVKRLLKE